MLLTLDFLQKRIKFLMDFVNFFRIVVRKSNSGIFQFSDIGPNELFILIKTEFCNYGTRLTGPVRVTSSRQTVNSFKTDFVKRETKLLLHFLRKTP